MDKCRKMLRCALFIMKGVTFNESHPKVKERHARFINLIEQALEV